MPKLSQPDGGRDVFLTLGVHFVLRTSHRMSNNQTNTNNYTNIVYKQKKQTNESNLTTKSKRT